MCMGLLCRDRSAIDQALQHAGAVLRFARLQAPVSPLSTTGRTGASPSWNPSMTSSRWRRSSTRCASFRRAPLLLSTSSISRLCSPVLRPSVTGTRSAWESRPLARTLVVRLGTHDQLPSPRRDQAWVSRSSIAHILRRAHTSSLPAFSSLSHLRSVVAPHLPSGVPHPSVAHPRARSRRWPPLLATSSSPTSASRGRHQEGIQFADIAAAGAAGRAVGRAAHGR